MATLAALHTLHKVRLGGEFSFQLRASGSLSMHWQRIGRDPVELLVT